jgi:hypothetical protein
LQKYEPYYVERWLVFNELSMHLFQNVILLLCCNKKSKKKEEEEDLGIRVRR